MVFECLSLYFNMCVWQFINPKMLDLNLDLGTCLRKTQSLLIRVSPKCKWTSVSLRLFNNYVITIPFILRRELKT